MLGRLGKIFLAAFVTELGGAVIRAGRGWLDRKFNPTSAAASEPQQVQPAPISEKA